MPSPLPSLFTLQVSRDYPLPRAECHRRIREAFQRNTLLSREEDVLKAVHFGRYKVSTDPSSPSSLPSPLFFLVTHAALLR